MTRFQRVSSLNLGHLALSPLREVVFLFGGERQGLAERFGGQRGDDPADQQD